MTTVDTTATVAPRTRRRMPVAQLIIGLVLVVALLNAVAVSPVTLTMLPLAAAVLWSVAVLSGRARGPARVAWVVAFASGAVILGIVAQHLIEAYG